MIEDKLKDPFEGKHGTRTRSKALHIAIFSFIAMFLAGSLRSVAPVLPVFDSAFTHQQSVSRGIDNGNFSEKDAKYIPHRPRFAVLSGFVTKDTSKNAPRVASTLLDHLVNKACYADLWGYDHIFNTTWGFDKSLADRHWLDYGTWHRVPHMQAALSKYEWILYADNDYVFQDLTRPLDSFIKEWELYGKHDVHAHP